MHLNLIGYLLLLWQGELEVIKEFPHGTDSETELNNAHKETSRMTFKMLGLDLPPPPLFKDVMEKNIIPQVSVEKENILMLGLVVNSSH